MESKDHPATERSHNEVLRYRDCDRAALAALLFRYGLRLERAPDDEPVAGSYWGEGEAGLIGDRVVVRQDTPVHSILHEACHFICMDSQRRRSLHTDAGGDHEEENAVCYLQILLAGHLRGVGRERMFSDMDAWGYSFRLGSARAWFESDAGETLEWLRAERLLGDGGQPTWRLRSGKLS